MCFNDSLNIQPFVPMYLQRFVRLTDSFYDFSKTTNMEVEMANKFSYSFGYWWFKGKVTSDYSSQSNTERKTRYITASMRIERYYSSVREEVSPLSADAITLLNREDYVGFFKACGPTYVRGLRRAQEVTAFFIFTSTNTERSSEYSRQVQISSWRHSYSSSSKTKTKFNSESQSMRIVIQGYGLGLSTEGSETFVAQNLADYNRIMKFAFKTMTVNDDAFHIGMVYGMEIVPWVENTAFQVNSNLADEAIEIPLVLSLIPRAYRITDPTDLDFMDHANPNSDANRNAFTCKEASHEIDKYGYCCEAGSLYDTKEREYTDDDPTDRVCRPLRMLDPALIKDNLATNGEFVARMDRAIRFRMNQLSTLERCISAARAIPERYDYYLLKSQDGVKLDGVVDIEFSVFELKIALDPFNDYAMLKHMAKELDEFLDMFVQPCYGALFGSNVGNSPETDPSFFMAYPWHTHDECTKLSCFGNSMRWDRSNPEGGCIPSMISGSDAPGYDAKNEDNCKKDVETGVLECKHNGVILAGHHTKTTNIWKEVLPRGRVDFFLDNFCMPDITAEVLPVEVQLELKEKYAKAGGSKLPETKTNVALNQPTTQSSTGWGGVSKRAVDGNTSGNYWHYSVTHTNYEQNPSWKVTLDRVYDIAEVVVYNRSDCCSSRINPFTITIREGNNVAGQRQDVIRGDHKKYEKKYPKPYPKGDQVIIQLHNKRSYLQLAEVEVYSMVTVEKTYRGVFPVNEYMYSPNMKYGLVYQSDNNLVLYNLESGKALWASDTCCHKAGEAKLSPDGTLTVKDHTGSTQGTRGWTQAGGISGSLPAYLVVMNSGRVNIYNPNGGSGQQPRVKWYMEDHWVTHVK